MTVILLRTPIGAPCDVVFDLTIDVDVHTRSAAATGERAVRGVVGGRMRLGDTVTWRARHFGVWWHLTARITEYDRPGGFTVVQERGPFAHLLDRHEFHAVNGGCVLERRFEYSAPMGPLGRAFDHLVLRRHMERFLGHRDGYIKRLAEERVARPAPAS